MIKIGIVDIDTSHPGDWLPLLKQSRKAAFTALYDCGDTCDPATVQQFADTHGLQLCRSLEELVKTVDVGFILGCNWDAHIERAKPFIDAGKPVFIDKPLVGNLRDLLILREWAVNGARIIGASGVPYTYEVNELRQKMAENGETILSAFVTTGIVNDPFNYSIHGVEMLRGLVGTGAQSVRHLASNRSIEIYEIAYASGVRGYLQIMTPFHTFAATVTTDKAVHQTRVDTNRFHKAFVAKIVEALEGNANAMDGVDATVESVKVALAMRQSLRTGQSVSLNDLRIDDKGYDGVAFAKYYRLAKMAAAKA